MDGFYVSKFKKFSNKIPKVKKDDDEDSKAENEVKFEEEVKFDEEEDAKIMKGKFLIIIIIIIIIYYI